VAPAPPPPPPPPPPPLPPQSFFKPQDLASLNNSLYSDEGKNGSRHYEMNTVKQNSDIKLPQQCVPTPKMKMKQLTWSKIPPNRIIGKPNLWTKFLKSNHHNAVDCNENNLTSDGQKYFQMIEDFFKTSENPHAESHRKDPNLRENRIWTSNEKVIQSAIEIEND
jgi:hypothetical protein